MIYTPAYFNASEKPDLIRTIFERYNFATLITQDDGGLVISHLPFLCDFKAKTGTCNQLKAHMAFANPHTRSLRKGGESTVIFQGPHAYISPRWYQPAPDNVPTWNYAVVHMHGKVRILDDEAVAYAQMQELVRAHDPEYKLDLSEKDRKGLLRGIAVFILDVEKIEAKFKLSQNRSEVDRRTVAEQLAAGGEAERETAKLMLEE